MKFHCKLRVNSLVCFVACMLFACDQPSSPTESNISTYVIGMDQDYDTTEPFVNALLFYAVKDLDTLNLSVEVQMECAKGTLQVLHHHSKEVLWSKTWETKTDSSFTISLTNLKKDEEFDIQFQATGVENVSMILSVDKALFKYRTKSSKQ